MKEKFNPDKWWNDLSYHKKMIIHNLYWFEILPKDTKEVLFCRLQMNYLFPVEDHSKNKKE